MHFTAFENAYFLQSIGWAILNSFWQAGCLVLIYLLLTLSKKTSALYKYNLSLVFLFAAFIWFISTIVQTYLSLKSTCGISGSTGIALQAITAQQLSDALPWLSFIYIGLICIQLTKFIRSYKKVSFVKKNNLHKAPLDIRLFIRNIAAHIGIRDEVNIWLSENIHVPSVIGFVKPVILLPAAVINHLSMEQLEAVLLHELAHIKRNDFLINLFQSFIEIVLAFNPFAMLLSNYAKKERENCCDDWVLNYQYDRHQYANALLVLEEQRQQQFVLAMAATNKKGILLNRIKRMFYAEPQTNIRFSDKLQFALVSVLFFAGIFFVKPFINNANNTPIATIQKTTAAYIRKPLAIADPVNNKETIADKIIIEPKVKFLAKKRTAQKSVAIKPSDDYTIALINNDLIRQPHPTIAIAANDEETTDSSYYVKIEEEQSGKKQMTVYYFQLNKGKDKNSIKPLIMLRKPIRVTTKFKNNPDTTISVNKRITS